MPQGRRTSLVIALTLEERRVLQAWQRSTTIQVGPARRGRIILMLADRSSVTEVARVVGIRRRFIYKWAQRFTEYGLPGLADKGGRGQPAPSTPSGEATPARPEHTGRTAEFSTLSAASKDASA